MSDLALGMWLVGAVLVWRWAITVYLIRLNGRYPRVATRIEFGGDEILMLIPFLLLWPLLAVGALADMDTDEYQRGAAMRFPNSESR